MSFETLRVPRAVHAAVMLLVLAVPAAAQTPAPTPVLPVREAPIPWLVIDARGGFAGAGRDITTATGLGVDAADMPGRLRTAVVGGHIYPLRRGSLKIGVGAEMLLGRGSSQRLDSNGDPTGPVIRRRLNGVSGQISLNFGKGKGWSYITVGSGPYKFESYLDDAVPDGEKMSTLNWGGGARWFARSHLAVNIDLRFYLTRPSNPTAMTAGRGRQRVMLLSAGISLK